MYYAPRYLLYYHKRTYHRILLIIIIVYNNNIETTFLFYTMAVTCTSGTEHSYTASQLNSCTSLERYSYIQLYSSIEKEEIRTSTAVLYEKN